MAALSYVSRIIQSSDDGNELALGTVQIANTNMGASNANDWIATRFQNVTIPQGAVIRRANITVFSLSAGTPDMVVDIYAEASDNAATLTTAANSISSRSRTVTKTTWNELGLSVGTHTSPDLSAPIQEIVNRAGWVSGNSIMLIWDGLTGCNIQLRTWDFDPTIAALLYIEYSFEGSIPTIASPLTFYLITEQMPTVYTGKLDGTPANPSFLNLNGKQGVTGSFGSPIPGMTVIFANDDQQAARLRTFTLGATGTFSLTVGENDDVTPYVVNNDDIAIVGQFRLWPIYPKIVLAGDIATLYEDYNVAYSDQTRLWKPVAVAGPPAVVEYNGATAQAKFVGDRSFALAPSASISSYLWTAPKSVEGTSSSQGTEVSPATFTYTAPGQYLVSLQVTDSNGKNHTNYTWVFVIDPNNPTTVAYTEFDNQSDNFDYEQGGGAASFMVHGGATISDFPNECLVIMASRPTTPGETTPTGCWPFRTNVHFVGYVIGDSVRQNPIEGDVSFQAATIDSLMKNLTAFPVSLTDTASPTAWTEAYALTTDRACSYLWHYHSTLSLMASIQRSNYQALIWRQDFGPSDLFSQLSGELMASLWGKVIVNHQGVVYHEIDYNLMLDSERALVTVRKQLHKGLWLDDVAIEERMSYGIPVNTVKMSGVLYLGTGVIDVCPSFSEAPGNAPRPYGKELNYDRLILTNQDDLNTRCGRGLAKAIVKYSAYTMRFVNDGSFTIAPQELFTSRIESTDNNRGLSLTPRLLPRRISRQYNHDLGLIDYSVSFEPETDGPDGVTVDLPCGPPGQKRNNDDDPPDVPDDPSAKTSLTVANDGSSFYFSAAVNGSYERRVKGLNITSAFEDMIPDPWTYFKQGYSIDNIILWGCGPNFLAQSKDSGKNWGDHTVYMDVPPNSWSDGSAPSFTGTLVKQVLGDYYRQDTFYCLLQTVYGGNYRGWIYHTVDDGFNFTAYALTGTSSVLPIRMDIDTEDATTLWLTLWDGDLKLRKYTVSATSLTLASTTTLVSSVSAQDVLDKVQIAYPRTGFGSKSLIYLYGRMVNPASLSGTIAIMRSSNGGAGWNAVISDWSTDHCGAFHVGEQDANGARAIWAVRQGEGT